MIHRVFEYFCWFEPALFDQLGHRSKNGAANQDILVELDYRTG
jgi:hypothetical protein